MVVVAGTPGSGKTSVLMHAVKDLIKAGAAPALVKIDCMWTPRTTSASKGSVCP
jgi:Ni2+-binding GTPase involved in maturation of urease and hydrogenase